MLQSELGTRKMRGAGCGVGEVPTCKVRGITPQFTDVSVPWTSAAARTAEGLSVVTTIEGNFQSRRSTIVVNDSGMLIVASSYIDLLQCINAC